VEVTRKRIVWPESPVIIGGAFFEFDYAGIFGARQLSGIGEKIIMNQ
jgi:hypothetical protein